MDAADRRRRCGEGEMGSVGFQSFQLDEVRARLRTMSDDELLRFGRAAASLCRPEANFGQSLGRVFVEQLEETRREWRRRHPKARDEA